MNTKRILVLARRDHTEAMRVAAGLTICGHEIRLVFMREAVADTEANAEQAELLELCDIEPETTLKEMADDVPFLNTEALGRAIADAALVVNL